MKPRPDERTTALLGMAAHNDSMRGPCPSGEDMAAFVDGKMKHSEAHAIERHLNSCPSCYYEWLEVTADLEAIEAVPKPAKKPVPISTWSKITSIFSSWQLPVAALAGLALVAVTISLSSPAQDIGRRIDDTYVEFAEQTPDQVMRVVERLPKPGDSSIMGFNEIAVTPPRQAFGAGVWEGRRDLLRSNEALPEFLASGTNHAWSETEWSDYYSAGRWMVLLWTLAQSGLAEAGDWSNHRKIADALASRLEKRSTEAADRIVVELRRLEALLEAVRRDNSEIGRLRLSRQLRTDMQQLGPL